MTVVPGLVSTIIPVFNRPDMLREAVASVFAQTYRPVEVIVVDDGSTDSTPAACEELAAAHPEVTVTRTPNGGPGRAREAGRQAARGEFVQYLDSDDKLEPGKFAVQVAALRNNPDCGVAYCMTREYGYGDPIADVPSAQTGVRFPTLFPHLLKGRIWQTVSPLFRRTVTDAIGPWSDLRQEEDWEYDARVAATGTRLVWNDEFLADFRHHRGSRAGGGSFGDLQKMQWRSGAHRLILQHAVRHGVPIDDPCMQHFARELFLLARQCGASGLAVESQELFRLAIEASGPERARAWDFRLYQRVAAALGWVLAGRLACWSDRFRSV